MIARRISRDTALGVALIATGFHIGARWTGGVAQPQTAFAKPDWMLEVQTALAVSLWLIVGGVGVWLLLDYHTEATA